MQTNHIFYSFIDIALGDKFLCNVLKKKKKKQFFNFEKKIVTLFQPIQLFPDATYLKSI